MNTSVSAPALARQRVDFQAKSAARLSAFAIYGLGAVLFGATAFVWRDFNTWQPADGLNSPILRAVLLYATAVAQIIGGIAIQRRETLRFGSAALLCVAVIYAIFRLPHVVATPLVYAPWGGLSENLSIVAGAMILFGLSSRDGRQGRTLVQAGRVLFTVCVASFMLYQAFYIPDTASLVPKWIPPSQVFWAIATTIAFGLAALALALRRADVLATRLLTAMLLIFQVTIWIPMLVASPHSHMLWAANAQNFSIAGAAWIVSWLVSSAFSDKGLEET